MKCLFLLIVLMPAFLFANSSYAQISEGLYKIVPKDIKPKNRLQLTIADEQNLLFNASDYCTNIYFSELDSLAAALEKQTSSENNINIKLMSRLALSNYYYTLNVDYRRSLDGYLEVAQNNEFMNTLNNDRLRSLLLISSLYIQNNKPDSAADYYHLLLNMLQARKDTVGVGFAYNEYGFLLFRLMLFEKAARFNDLYIRSFPAKDRWNTDYTYAVLWQINMFINAKRSTGKKEYGDSALHLIKQVMTIKKNEADKWYGGCYTMMAMLAASDNQYEKALSYSDSSLSVKYDTNEMLYRHSVVKPFGRAVYLIKTGRYAEGKRILDTLHFIGDSRRFLQMMYETLYQYHEAKGNWKEALKYHELYRQYSDSIDLIKQQAIMFEADQKYASTKKDAAIVTLKNKELAQRSSIINIAAASAVVLLALIALIRWLMVKNKKERLQRIMERRKLLAELHSTERRMNDEHLRQQLENDLKIEALQKSISRNMHDEIGSSLATLRYLVTDMKRNATSQETKKILADVEQEIKHVYIDARDFIHDLYNEHLQQDHDVAELLQNLSESFGKGSSMRIITDIDKASITEHFTQAQNVELYHVIREAVTNSIKHSGATQMKIEIRFDGDRFHFNIQDNGRGMKQADAEGLGISSMRERMKNLNGDLQVRSNEEGTSVAGYFPA